MVGDGRVEPPVCMEEQVDIVEVYEPVSFRARCGGRVRRYESTDTRAHSRRRRGALKSRQESASHVAFISPLAWVKVSISLVEGPASSEPAIGPSNWKPR